MVREKGGVIRVGMGSALYGFVGRWVPRGLVAWMMGVRSVESGIVEGEFGRRRAIMGGSSEGSDSEGSRSASPRVGGTKLGGFGDSEYVSVYQDQGGEDQDQDGHDN